MRNKELFPQKIALIGATGSVGHSVLSVVDQFPERFQIHSMAGGSDEDALVLLCEKYHPAYATLWDKVQRDALYWKIRTLPTEILSSKDPLMDMAEDPHVDHVIFASSGTKAIPALCKALACGKTVSVANKESIIVGAPWVMPLVQDLSCLRPLDSEHNALWQCLKGEKVEEVAQVVLTASGGPFREKSLEELQTVTAQEALQHPVWSMGVKITLDSATLMNKGFEILEANGLFRIPLDKIHALMDPCSKVHGVVRFVDGCSKYLAFAPDMKVPAAVALAYPHRIPFGLEGVLKQDPEVENITFYPLDGERFGCLPLAYEVGRRRGAYPALLVGADEVVVASFLKGEIGFLDIPKILEKVLENYQGKAPSSLDEALFLVEEGKLRAQEICSQES